MSEQTAEITYSSFEDIAGETFADVTVGMPVGKAFHFRLKIQSAIEWDELWYSLLDAVVPRSATGKGGEKQPNLYDVEYRKDAAQVERARKLLIVTQALLEGGRMAVPGRELNEQSQALGRRVPGVVIDALFDFLDSHQKGGRAALDDNGVLFRALSAVSPQGNGTLQALTAVLERAVALVEADAHPPGEAAGSPDPGDLHGAEGEEGAGWSGDRAVNAG